MATPRWLFTSDLHFGHKNIIEYCDRPWPDTDAMDRALIARWNLTVRPCDIVVHAGDLTLKHRPDDVLDIIKQLNGQIIWVKGNHDWWHKRLKAEIKMYDIYRKAIPLPDGKKQLIEVCHYPLRSWSYGSWQLHGHTHGGLEPLPYQYDVGTDSNNYQPISWDQLVRHFTREDYAEKYSGHQPGQPFQPGQVSERER